MMQVRIPSQVITVKLIFSVTILGLYRLFKQFSAAALSPVEEQTHTSLIGSIRDYLTSRTPNEIYLFLSCLESVDPGLWAGTSEAIPAVLEAWEVEQIMHFLDSNDNLIRKKVCEPPDLAKNRWLTHPYTDPSYPRRSRPEYPGCILYSSCLSYYSSRPTAQGT